MAEHDYIQESTTQRLRSWILSEMMRGAGYALAFLLAIALIFTVIWGVGQFLPEERLNTPPPMPFSALQAPLHDTRA